MAFNELNPMLLPNIVSNILENIYDPSTLEKLRLVCQCWNQEACLFLRRLRTIEFTNLESMNSYKAIYNQTDPSSSAFSHAKFRFSFRNLQQPSTNHPNSSNGNIEDSLPTFYNSVDDFLKIFGENIICCYIPVRASYFEASFLDLVLNRTPNITTLGLHIQYYHRQTLPIQFSPSTIRNLQNVRNLIIQIDGFEMSEEMATELLSLLFLYLPNLQRITHSGDIRRISKTGHLLRDIILDSESSATLAKLSSLEFKIRLLEEHCLKLLCANFPMKILYIDLYNPDDDDYCVSSDIMAGLLRKWSSTLLHLEIEFPYRKEVSFHFHFPVIMENLRILYLGGFEGCLFDLLKKLPRLFRLELSQLELSSILPKPEENDVYPNVEQLRLDFCMGQTAGILSRFSRIFPQLRNLNINHTTNEVVRVIFQKMGHLSTLRIQGNDLTDAAMCGFSEYATKENDFLSITPKHGRKFRKYPYVGDLKELHYLKLDAYALTEVTVRHGLVHCSSLRLVKMDSTAGAKDSTTVSRKFRLSGKYIKYNGNGRKLSVNISRDNQIIKNFVLVLPLEYESHLVEEGQGGIVEIKEEPPLEEEALAFFQSHSHNKFFDDLLD